MPHADAAARKAYHREWYLRNRAKQLAKQREYYEANRDRQLAYNKSYLYGVTAEQHAEMRVAQGNKCAICGSAPGPSRSLATDHCHRTGRVRQLLCDKCNTGIGQFKDDPVMLRRAAEYLERHATVSH